MEFCVLREQERGGLTPGLTLNSACLELHLYFSCKSRQLVRFKQVFTDGTSLPNYDVKPDKTQGSSKSSAV